MDLYFGNNSILVFRSVMIIPVIIGAIALGGAFNYPDLQPKSIYQIFDYNAVRDNIVEQEFESSDGKYKVVESADEAFKVLRVDPAVALKSMNGDAAIKGFGSYISQAVNRKKVVDILISYEILKRIQTFPTTVQQGKGWQNKPQRLVGTHYVNGIHYGGHLVISIQFRPTRPEYVDEVRSIVNSEFGQEGGLDSEFFGKLERLSSALGDKTALGLYYSSTIGPISGPSSLEDVKRLVDGFPDFVTGINHGRGGPLKISLEDLHAVQSNFTEFKVSKDVETLLYGIQEKYDDLRIAIHEFQSWDGQGQIWPEDQQKQIDEYVKHLRRANRAMRLAVSELDITGSTSQFDKALKEYDYDGEEKVNRYTTELQELIDSLEGKSLFRTIYSSLLAIQGESRTY